MLGQVPFPLRFLLAGIYRAVFCAFRITLYRPKKPLQKSRVWIVGSFLAGGAGKTPLVQRLSELLTAQGYRVAILCHQTAWDEFRMLQSSPCGASVFQTSNRYKTAKQLDGKFDILLCDGGLEDTRFVNATRFVLRWDETAKSLTDLFPCGSCVSLEKDHPDAWTIDGYREQATSSADMAKPNFAVTFGIEKIQNLQGKSLSPNSPVAVVTGIGNPKRFALDIESFGLQIQKCVFLTDHSKAYARVLRAELDGDLPIVLSEKDAARLSAQEKENPALYIAKERVQINSALLDYLKAADGGAAKNPPSTL